MVDPSKWWVVPEGTLGQVIDSLSPNGITHFFGATGNQAVWTVKQAATKPAHAANEGPFPTKVKAHAAAAALNAKENIASDVQQALGSADQPSSPSQLASVPSLSQIGDFFGRLEEASTWVRFAQVVLGLILIGIGVARIAGHVPAGAVPVATKLAATLA